MINRALTEQTEEIRQLVNTCFPDVSQKYLDYYFKTLYRPENCFVKTLEGRIVGMLIRAPHDLMFNGRAISTSMITGVCTIPSYRGHGCMKELMNITVDACEHSELITLVKTESPSLYEPYGFRTIYNRSLYTIERKDVKRITNFGCAFEPSPLDLLKVYSAFIKRFNGYYARDIEYFTNYKRQITMEGGKIVAYYNGKNQIQGYAAMIPVGDQLRVDEIIYLDSMALIKLCNVALQEKRIVNLSVSEAEDLSKVFPDAPTKTYGSVMARLNDPALFTRVFEKKVSSIEDIKAISRRPLNLNEYE